MEYQDIQRIVDGRTDLKKYAQNALMLWALQNRYQIDDIDGFASSYLTDGSDDKKCDLIWVNRDEGFAIIAQNYKKENPTKTKEAPTSKASDLNTAVAWVLGDEDISNLPEIIRYGVEDVREAIKNHEISQIYFFYIHNLPESTNVKRELKRVKTTAERYLSSDEINVFVQEIGQTTIIEWYQNLQNPILVTDEFELPLKEGFWTQGEKWKSFSTTITGKQLNEWYQTHGKRLFSANHRDYLGSINSDKNINNGIKNTAQNDPGNFWVYNNGISIMTNGIKVLKRGRKLKVTGISIINGAQTTGSIGSVEIELDESIQVYCRFIECNDQELIKEIVRYNNLQNKLISSDFRSNDRIQKKLIDGFEHFTGEGLVYTGGRRGGSSDVIARRPNLISSDSVAQSLTAFHGRPDIGYKFKSRIWEENEDYKRVFNEKTTTEHILFVYSLYKEIINVRAKIKDKVKREEGLTDAEQKYLDFFNARGSVFVLIYAISESMELFLNRRVDDKFDLCFTKPLAIDKYQEFWNPIISIALSFSDHLLKGLQNYSLTMDSIEDAVNNFTGLVDAVKEPNHARLHVFAERVKSQAR